jgi:hypothetical protein
MSLIGSLSDVKLAEVLRVFSTGKKTGRLTVSGEDVQGVVRFQRGSIVHATAGRLHGEEALLDLFGWKEGELTFVPEDRQITPNIQRDVDSLILEGLRVGDVVHRMHGVIPSERAVFQLGLGPTDPEKRWSVGGLEWRVLRALDGIRDVREVVEVSRVPRADVMRVLFEMTEAGFLERVEPQKTLRVQSQGLFGKDAAEIDDHLELEWKRISRFERGVARVEVRSSTGKAVILGVTFRPALARDIHLPRAAVGELAVRDGDEVGVRPLS